MMNTTRERRIVLVLVTVMSIVMLMFGFMIFNAFKEIQADINQHYRDLQYQIDEMESWDSEQYSEIHREMAKIKASIVDPKESAPP